MLIIEPPKGNASPKALGFPHWNSKWSHPSITSFLNSSTVQLWSLLSCVLSYTWSVQSEEFGLTRATFFLMMGLLGCNSLSVVSSCLVKYYDSKLRAVKKNVVTHYSRTTKIQTTIITPKEQYQFSSTWPNDHDQPNLMQWLPVKENLQILLQYAAQHVVTFSKHSVLLNAEQSTQPFFSKRSEYATHEQRGTTATEEPSQQSLLSQVQQSNYTHLSQRH